MLKYAVFVHDTQTTPYAVQITNNEKPIETRPKNSLKQCVKNRVYIVRTYSGKKPLVIGSGYIASCQYYDAATLDSMREQTKIPAGSKYDCKTAGKYGYNIIDCISYKKPFTLEMLPITKRCRSYCTIDQER